MIRIVDRELLERRSCECYRLVSGVYTRKLTTTDEQHDLDAQEGVGHDQSKLVAGASNL